MIGSEQLREVRLYGWLGKKYGRVHRVAVSTPREAAQALAVILPGFQKDVIDHREGFHIFVGALSKESNIGEDALDCLIGKSEAVCIVPVVQGAKSALLSVVLGGAIFALGFISGGSAWLMFAGVGIALGGVIQALMPNQQQPDNANDSRLSSFAFGSVANSTEQGVAIPVVYGEVIAGSVVTSQGLSAVELAV